MLKFTIKLISDAGYHSEITSTSTASHQPEVFSGLFRDALLHLTSSSVLEVRRHLREFTHLVCNSQQTYFYSQAVLQSLRGGGEEGGAKEDFRRWLEGEMQAEAQSGHHEVTNMTLNFRGVGAYPRLFEALAAMLSRNTLNPADISILHKLYSGSNPPPASCLHIPQLLGKLCTHRDGRRHCECLLDMSVSKLLFQHVHHAPLSKLVVFFQNCWCRLSSSPVQPSTLTTKTSTCMC